MVSFPLITIDGPAASGKTTVSRELARALRIPFVSTGSFYRALAYMVQLSQVSPTNEPEILRLIDFKVWSVQLTTERTRILHQGQDVTEACNQESVGSLASQISSLSLVRKALLQAQRDCYRAPGLVAEGRDCGTVVFPDAHVKFYLTAHSESRADRRAQEQGLSRSETARAQKQRDFQDQTRASAPLQIPDKAHVIDTSDMSLQEVIDRTLQLSRVDLRARGASLGL